MECTPWSTRSQTPTPGFTFNVVGMTGRVDFTSNITGSFDSVTWDYGDGNTGTGTNPSHTYAEEGIYEVTLTITTDEGCESTLTLHICIGEGGFSRAAP